VSLKRIGGVTSDRPRDMTHL